jgi:hypothetical protein
MLPSVPTVGPIDPKRNGSASAVYPGDRRPHGYLRRPLSARLATADVAVPTGDGRSWRPERSRGDRPTGSPHRVHDPPDLARDEPAKNRRLRSPDWRSVGNPHPEKDDACIGEHTQDGAESHKSSGHGKTLGPAGMFPPPASTRTWGGVP